MEPFSRYWPFVREIHRSRWVPHTKASDAVLWCRNNWQKWRDTTSASRLCDVTGQAWRRYDGGLEKTVLGENSDDPDSKVDGANMGHTWGRQDPGGPHVGPMNFTTIWGAIDEWFQWDSCVQGIKLRVRNKTMYEWWLFLAMVGYNASVTMILWCDFWQCSDMCIDKIIT